jgi:hypothetical protein
LTVQSANPSNLDKGFAAVADIARRAAAFGVATSKDGAKMYGHVPHIAPQAWFHIIYPGLTPTHIHELERELGMPIPRQYAAFLQRSNGLTLFSGQLDMYGRRTDYSRDPQIRQPFDLALPNVKERPRLAQPSWFIVGFYRSDGSHAYVVGESPEVFRANRDMSEPTLSHWPSLGAFIASEISRLEGHFDSTGHRIDPKFSTAPDFHKR